MKKFYITTPIYYPNDILHIGHAYTTIAGDILARWNRIKGNEVFFLTGTDEHGKKIAEVAKSQGKNNKEFVDELVLKIKEDWKKLNLTYDFFIRTTDNDHKKIVSEILQKVYDKGDIYKGEYEGFYCTGCEAYYTEKDLIEGECPIHKKKVELLKEESYFFKLSKYQNKLLEHYKKNPEFISPKFRQKEIINRVKEGLKDLSISRTNFDWGIPMPFDKSHICYVWFDALLNYYSATRKKGKEELWPADVHLIGKDIIWFHTVYWPAMLMSAGIKLPKKVFAHGWWTFDKEKISKSRGKVINIEELISIAGVDSARYFLFRETPFGDDGDFSETALINRHNDELANKLGNLISRVSNLAEKYGLEKTENKIIKKSNITKIEKHIESYEFDKALNEIFSLIDKCNEHIQNKKPWETQDSKVLYELSDSIKSITILLYSFIPSTSEKIAKTFSFELLYENINKPLKISKIKKSEILFEKIDIKKSFTVERQVSARGMKETQNPLGKVNDFKEKNNQENKIQGIMTAVEFKDWEKIDIRVAQIKSVEDIEGADKLYKLTLDVGELGEKTVCAGIKQYYKKSELKNKKVIYFSNLTPRKMRGIMSEGMLLAAGNKESDTCVLITPEKEIENGSRIS